MSGFRSGNTALDDYLVRDALRETQEDIDRSFIGLLESDGQIQIAGYFTLSTTYQFFAPAPNAVEDNLYLAKLSCLARTENLRGQRIGDVLLVRALCHVAEASKYLALRGVWLTATAEGIPLYERFGFVRLYPDRPTQREFFLPIHQVRYFAELAES